MNKSNNNFFRARISPKIYHEGLKKTAIIIPVLNEEEAIPKVLRDLPIMRLGQIIVVDNGSTDKTASAAMKVSPKIQVITENRRGYGRACLTGINHLSPQIESIGFLDGDYSDYPKDLHRLCEPLFMGTADFVLGSRTLIRKNRAFLTYQQLFGNFLATSLINIIWGKKFTDLGPFRLIQRNLLESLSMNDENFGWTIEMQIKAARKTDKIREVPVRYRARIGKSKISGTVTGTIKAGSKILYVIFREFFSELKRKEFT